ncbi:hypothetical protein [Variovorax sp. J22R115]|uniref:hypothetical protein n=1 Tax=Variovorax sp. J22R115 TaxID=3053509 RepID=UPI002576008F|nr:hypothetical protein [Variovorax sp. J22R115]MDM0047561.1 hypothetical protein [Variovorax sp. J22R115]
MKKLLKSLLILLIVLAALVGIVIAWTAHRLSKDQPAAPRTQYSKYEMGDGAADGSPKPDATGYVVDKAGRGRILPPMPPEKPMDVHTAANYRKNFSLKSCFWPGPRARSGVFTNDSSSFAMENQFPDTATTYIPTAFRLPEGAKLVISGDYPHMRHWNFNTYNAKGEPQNALSDVDIDPDAGSSNPFRPGVARDVQARRYTFSIVNGTVPAQRAKNTLYTMGPAGQDIFLWMRNYVPDGSVDYLGGVAFPEVELHLADGKVLKGDEACQGSTSPMRGKQLANSVDPRAWVALTSLPWVDTANVGARNVPALPLQAFFNRKQVVTDLFLPALKQADPPQLGGWWSNLASRYGYAYMSRNYGTVYVMTAKMPRVPKTWHGEAQNAANVDMRYMSVCTATALTAAMTPDCIYDEQLLPTVDDTGRYAVAISRGEDRPKNATLECGVAWIDAGNGDGMVSGSPDYMMVINRNTLVNPEFKQSWFAVTKPGTEREAMGDYLPYMLNLKNKANFEALGCPVNKRKLYAMLPRAID